MLQGDADGLTLGESLINAHSVGKLKKKNNLKLFNKNNLFIFLNFTNMYSILTICKRLGMHGKENNIPAMY